MASIIIPSEWKEKKPFVYYSLHIWHDSKTYADMTFEYDTCSDAICELRSRLNRENNHIEMATIREQIIYKRLEDTELSTSSPLIHYDEKTGFRI